MKVKLVPTATKSLVNPNAHLFGEPEGETELVVFSAKVWVDGAFYGTAQDCDMGRWIVCNDADSGSAEDMGPIDGCYPADSVQALAFALAECCDDINHGDVSVADLR